MTKILITGGSGLVGKKVSALLQENGHECVWLSRRGGNAGGIRVFEWDIARGHIDESAFEGVRHIIHLAGAGIMDRRWTKKYRQEIIDSRVKSCELLYEGAMKHAPQLAGITGASATGYYGTGETSHLFNEDDRPGTDFLARVCVEWENSYRPFAARGTRTVVLRTGVVLAHNGGAYPKLRKVFRMGLGAALGSGRQFFPWIHIDDLARMYAESCMNESWTGVYNAVAPEVVRNYDFSKALAESFGKQLLLPAIPGWALRAALGEAATALTTGQRISCAKITEAGFNYQFPLIREALADLALNRST